MFWYLYLAHFLADYPLQPGWLVAAKRYWWGLTIHVSIQFVTTVVVVFLVGGARSPTLFLFVLLLAGTHFAIDAFKNYLTVTRPNWMMGPYLFDQFLHLVSILLITWLIWLTVPAGSLPAPANWPIYLIGYLLATQIWFITERIYAIAHKERAYQDEMERQQWRRMAGRALLLTAGLWGWQRLLGGAPFLALSSQIPYLTGAYRQRALRVDVAVAVTIAVLVHLAVMFT